MCNQLCSCIFRMYQNSKPQTITMKKIFIILLALGAFTLSFAQQPTTNPYPRTITVNGSAELEIVPDEIFVNITLSEYQKRGEAKKSLDQIRKEFIAALKAAGITDDQVSIAQYSGSDYFNWWRKKQKDPDMMATITYEIKFKTGAAIDELVKRLDDEATKYFAVVSVKHSNEQEIRKNLKIQAVKAAREKAQYLSAAIDEKIGVAVTISEPVEHYPIPYKSLPANIYGSMAAGTEMAVDNSQFDFRKIKMKYEVQVVFSLV